MADEAGKNRLYYALIGSTILCTHLDFRPNERIVFFPFLPFFVTLPSNNKKHKKRYGKNFNL